MRNLRYIEGICQQNAEVILVCEGELEPHEYVTASDAFALACGVTFVPRDIGFLVRISAVAIQMYGIEFEARDAIVRAISDILKQSC